MSLIRKNADIKNDKQDATLSQGVPRDAAVNFGT